MPCLCLNGTPFVLLIYLFSFFFFFFFLSLFFSSLFSPFLKPFLFFFGTPLVTWGAKAPKAPLPGYAPVQLIQMMTGCYPSANLTLYNLVNKLHPSSADDCRSKNTFDLNKESTESVLSRILQKKKKKKI